MAGGSDALGIGRPLLGRQRGVQRHRVVHGDGGSVGCTTDDVICSIDGVDDKGVPARDGGKGEFCDNVFCDGGLDDICRDGSDGNGESGDAIGDALVVWWCCVVVVAEKGCGDTLLDEGGGDGIGGELAEGVFHGGF